MKRKSYEVKEGGKFNDPALSSMRDSVFGRGMTQFLLRTEIRQNHRNDAEIIRKAEEKRARKAARK